MNALSVMQGVYLSGSARQHVWKGFPLSPGSVLWQRDATKPAASGRAMWLSLPASVRIIISSFLSKKNMFEALYMFVIASYCFCRELTHLYNNCKWNMLKMPLMTFAHIWNIYLALTGKWIFYNKGRWIKQRVNWFCEVCVCVDYNSFSQTCW